MSEKKLFLQDEIVAVRAQYDALCKELDAAYKSNVPPKVTRALGNLRNSIEALRKARDNGNALGILQG